MAHQTRSDCTSALDSLKLDAGDHIHALRSLWEQTKLRQPDGFPWLSEEKGIKYSNALFCMARNVLHRQRGVSRVILWAPNGTVFNSDLFPREYLKTDSHKSVFDRNGFKTVNGEALKLTSHQTRHLLHTIGMRGGLSEGAAARWAGRADMKKNHAYNRMSEFEMVAKAETLDTALTLFGPAGGVFQHIPISTQEFNLMERGALHVTESGVCVYDYTMSPCEKFRDCLNYQEQVCIKRDGERLKRIKARLTEVEKDYAAAKEAIAQGYSGAGRWYEIQEKTVVRVRQLVQMGLLAARHVLAHLGASDGENHDHVSPLIQRHIFAGKKLHD